METVELGDGYTVPRIITGAWQLSAGHQARRSKADVFETLSRAVDAGLDTFDCADIYTGVEDLLGEFRRVYRERKGTEAAERIRVHTKFVPDLDALATLDKSYVERIVDRSLRRLRVERLDLVQFGWWTYEVDRFVETAVWIDEIRRGGKIRHVGVTNFDLVGLKAMVDAGVSVSTHQLQYSALDHRPEGGMSEYCLARGIGLLCYGTLAGGFLSDRYLGAPEPSDPLSNRSLVKYRLIIHEYGGWDAYQALLERMATIARRHEITVAQAALRYLLDRPGVAAAIVGVSSADRASETLGALKLELDPDESEAIHTLAAAAPGPRGPVYALERDRDGPHAAIMKYTLNRGD